MAKQYHWYRCPHKWGLCIQVRSSVKDFKGSTGAMISKPNEQTVKKLPRLWTRMSELQYTFPCQRPKRISSGQHIQSLNGQRGKSQTISCSNRNTAQYWLPRQWKYNEPPAPHRVFATNISLHKCPARSLIEHLMVTDVNSPQLSIQS